MPIPFSYIRQIRTVLLIELAMVSVIGAIVYFTWYQICGSGIQECLARKDSISFGALTVLSVFRPFMLTPNTFFHMIAVNQFGFAGGVAFSLLSTALSALSVFFLGKVVGKRLVTPWVRSNLPQTHQFLKSQDYKIIFFSRLMPFLHFDIGSFAFGAIGFRWRSVLLGSLVGELPHLLMTAYLSAGGPMDGSRFSQLMIISVAIIGLGLLGFEMWSRMRGRGLYSRLMAMYHELLYEVKVNNEIVKRYTINPEKIPVLLVYGFFSSRRTLTILERHLSAKGYDVLSFNLGGLFGVFFTRGILETARYIDEKLQRQFDRKNFQRIHIVAHSKGGLVALWWLLKLGGYRYCDKVICMGTPFQGSRLTYLGLVTPLGFVWRDLWQMRPGSPFLNTLRTAKVPKHVSVVCFYSNRDRVAPGACGILQNNEGKDVIQRVAMHHISHFEFLHRKEVAEKIAEYLGPPDRRPVATPYEPLPEDIEAFLEDATSDPIFPDKRASS